MYTYIYVYITGAQRRCGATNRKIYYIYVVYILLYTYTCVYI